VQVPAQSVLGYIRKHKLLSPGDRVGVAVSGGADSVALLRLTLDFRKELGIVLSVVHFNHKLRGADSDRDEHFVSALAKQHELQFFCDTGNVAGHGVAHHLSTEAAGRALRYQYFRRLLAEANLNRIATAHTLDDQAETLLMRLVRGAGTRGLAGIYPQLSVSGSEHSEEHQLGNPAIVRPLLSTKRKELEAYLEAIGQTWREDQSNRDLRHARNRVRREILPGLERDFNRSVREVLAETAEIARAEEDYWEKETRRLLGQAWKAKSNRKEGTIKLTALADQPLALQRRLVRAAAESLGLRLEFRHVEEVLGLAAKQTAVLPEGWTISRQGNELQFAIVTTSAKSPNYEFCLPLPGCIRIPELGSRFEALLVSGNAAEGYNREHLLNRAQLSPELCVRNWRAGDRFWPAHTKAPKKIKELLQELHLTGPDRRRWPVVVSGADIVWMRGFPVPSRFQPERGTGQMVMIRETAS
jgi:tRNA(Ile)-lysidine synthase